MSRTAMLAREPIAVVGLACRFPSAPDPRAFWELLRNGGDAVAEVPPERWDLEAFYDPDPAAPGKTYGRWGGFLPQVDGFDAEFFGIAAREARSMDPQQRLLLELAYEALEDAGLPPPTLKGGAVGVFVGLSTNDYGLLEPHDPRAIGPYWSTGNALNVAASRIAYFFDWHGPALAVDAACSASLVAVHYACLSLWAGECCSALAGGANLILSPTPMVHFAKAGVLARDGRCKAFDARADGIVRGEGAGLVLLEPLERALAQGHPVRAVIRGSAVNQDGQSNGLTAPSRTAQEAVLRAACRVAGVAPARVQYVEAHGTGTLLGDPIELRALGRVFGPGRAPERPCCVGSVKTNLGHLESAAGIASLIKVVLALQHGELPPSLHYREPNPHADLAKLHLAVQARLEPWPRSDGPRLAGVSSFGFGGTNAHVVLEEAPPGAHGTLADDDGRAHVLAVSAHAPDALRERADALARWLEACRGDDAPPRPAEIAFTAGARRAHHEQRLAAVFRTPAELAASLHAFARGRPAPGLIHGRRARRRAPRVVFVFAGQGAGWRRLGRAFVDSEPVFLAALERCDAVLRPQAGFGLVEALTTREDVPLDDMEFVQPAVFALQVALCALLAEWGVRPAAVVGHSLGELAAAHVAGVLGLEEALDVVWQRARLMQAGLRAPGERGGMAALRADLVAVRELLAETGGALTVAAHNGPRLVVVTGAREALRSLQRACVRRRIAARLLPVPGAGHGPELARLAGELARGLGGLSPRPAQVELVSTVTGGRVRGEELDGAYWGRNVAEPVLFAEAAAMLVDAGHDLFVEIGRQPLLNGALTETLAERGRPGLVLATLRGDDDPRETLLRALGELYVQGLAPRFEGLQARSGRCLELPTYPWQRRRFWFGPGPWQAPAAALPHDDDGVALGQPLRVAALPDTWLWQLELHGARGVCAEHTLEGLPLVPPSLWLEWLLSAAEAVQADRAVTLEDVRFLAPLFLPRAGAREIQVSWRGGADGTHAVQIHARVPGASSAELLASAHVRPAGPGSGAPAQACEDGPWRRVGGAELYARLARAGLRLGPALQVLAEAELAPGRCRVRPRPPAVPGRARFELLDAALRAALLAAEQDDSARWPISIERVESPLPAPREARLDARRRPLSDAPESVDVGVAAGADSLGVVLVGVRSEPRARHVRDAALLDWLYDLVWEEQAAAAPAPAQPGGFVLLGERDGVGADLARRLASAGHEVTHLDASTGAVAQLDEAARSRRLRGVIQLSALASPAADELTLAGLAEAQERGCLLALGVVQTLARLPAGARPRLWLVTRGAQPVAGRPAPAGLAQAPLWGFGRSVAAELRDLWGGLIDLDPGAAPAEQADALASAVAGAGNEDQIAFSAGRRYVARLARRDPVAAPRRAPAWSADGFYLITGGLGELGLALARWMAEQGARRLALLGRTPVPPRAQWPQLDPNTPSGARVAALQACESSGARVECVAVDVADEPAMVAALGRLRAELGPVRGVAHLAGVVHGAPLVETSSAQLWSDLRPKLLGGFVLDRLLADDPLDFEVLFSSGAAVLGSPFLAGYAAGNAFLDGLAHYRRARGRTALSVGWGFWEQGGLAARGRRELERSAVPRGLLGFSHAQGLRLLAHLLGGDGAAHVLPLHYDWSAWGAAHPAAAAAPLFEHLFAAPSAGLPAATAARRELDRASLLALPAVARAGVVEAWLCERVGAALGRPADTVDSSRPLTHLGLDSLMALELKDRLELDLGVTLPVAELLRGPSLAEIGAGVAAQIEAAPSAPTARERSSVAAAGLGLDDPASLLRHVDELPPDRVDELLRALGAAE